MPENTVAFLLPVATYVVIASCKGTVAIAFVLLCRRLFAGRLSAQARHGLWLAALASLLLPVGFGLSIELRREAPAMETRVASMASPVAGLAPATLTEPAQAESASHHLAIAVPAGKAPFSSIPLQSWMILLWAAVLAVLAAVPVFNLGRYLRIAARASPVSGQALGLLHQCKTRMGLRRAVRLLESADIASPVVFGWRSPTLLLPPGLQERLGATQLRHVFLHELAHVQRHDIFANWLMTCAQVLHWFNPVVWHGLRVMRSDMEQACDAKVLGLLSPGEHADYGSSLIGVLDSFPGRTPAQGLGVVEDHKQLKERIIMIAKFNSRKIGSPVLALVLLLGLTSVAFTQPQIGTAASNARPAADAILLGQTPQPVPAPTPVAQHSAGATERQDRERQIMERQRQLTLVAQQRSAGATESAPAARAAVAEPASAAAAPARGVAMEQLIEQVSKNIQKRFIVDPRAKGTAFALYGQKLDEIDYPGLLTILRVNDFTAVELNDYINVVPVSLVRTLPVPVVVDGRTYPDDQFVSGRIGLTRGCGMQIGTMMRQFVSQGGSLTPDPGSNSILMVDTFANFKRIESTIQDLDANSKSDGQCAPTPAPPAASAGAAGN